MSYSVDLWNSYNKVEYQLESHIKGLKAFIYILSEYHSSQTSLANELKRLSEYTANNPITSFESLSEGINSFQNDLLNQYDYLTEFLNNMSIEILEPLKHLKEKLTKELNNNLNEMISKDKNYNYYTNQIENAKNKFHNSVKEAEQFKLKSEIFKKKFSNNNNYNEEIKKNEIKFLNFLKNAKDNENLYITLINDTNKLQEEYIELKKKNLNEIQTMEEEIGETIKDSLRKYIVFQVSYIRNFQYDIDKKAKIMESINIIKDINNYINIHSTNEIPPFKYDYIPYLSELNNSYNKNNNIKIDKDIIKEVNNFIENIFMWDKEKEIILLKNKTNIEIESISEEIFTTNQEIKDFDKNKLDKINKYIADKRNRREFLKNLNNLRKKKGLNINNITYDNISKILNDCLDILIKDKQNDIDYESIIIIINLSSTLYKTSNDINNNMPRIFLQKDISEHKIWKNLDLWKGIIKYSIIEEMHNQKNFNIYSKEDFSTKKERISNIVKFKLNTYLYNMINFEIKRHIITEIIQDFKAYYDLSQNIIDSFYKIIDNNNIKNNEEKNKKDIKEEKNKKDINEEKNKEKEINKNMEKNNEAETKSDKDVGSTQSSLNINDNNSIENNNVNKIEQKI